VRKQQHLFGFILYFPLYFNPFYPKFALTWP